jgi:hypothetical protein
MARRPRSADVLALRVQLHDGAEIMLWSGTRGVIRDEGHQWRIEWPARVAFWSTWGLLERLHDGSIILV